MTPSPQNPKKCDGRRQSMKSPKLCELALEQVIFGLLQIRIFDPGGVYARDPTHVSKEHILVFWSYLSRPNLDLDVLICYGNLTKSSTTFMF